MKICAVTTWPPHKDGIALYSQELYNQLSKTAALQVIANKTKQPHKQKNGITISSCWKRGVFYPLHILRSLSNSGCNVVHIQHGWFLYGGTVSALLFPFLLVALRLSGKPCIVTMHTVIRTNSEIYKNSMVNLLAKASIIFVSRSIVHFSDKVIVHNQLMKQILHQEYCANKQKIVIIKHGTKTASTAEPFTKKTQTCILSLGFLRQEKAIIHLINAFKMLVEQYPQLELVVVGTGHAHDKNNFFQGFKNSVLVKNPQNLVFTGFVDEKTLNRLIHASDIVVLQSTKPHFIEASGTLATVANFGKALVCSKVPKFQSELKNGKHCLFVNSKNSYELKEALLLLMKNKKLRNDLGQNLKEHFKGTNWTNIAKQHLELYNSLITKKRRN